MSFEISPRMYFGIDEPWIAKLAQKYLTPGDVVYDVGAHIGYTVLLFAQSVGITGSVHAFEILPSVANMFLEKTIQANKLENIIVHNIGLSNEERELELPVGQTLMTGLNLVSNGKKAELCKTTRLDLYVAQKTIAPPRMIKIDIEGAESSCLLGGAKLIKRSKPLLIIEFHSFDLLRMGYSFFQPLGYKLLTEAGGVVSHQFLNKLDYFHESVLCLPAKINSTTPWSN